MSTIYYTESEWAEVALACANAHVTSAGLRLDDWADACAMVAEANARAYSKQYDEKQAGPTAREIMNAAKRMRSFDFRRAMKIVAGARYNSDLAGDMAGMTAMVLITTRLLNKAADLLPDDYDVTPVAHVPPRAVTPIAALAAWEQDSAREAAGLPPPAHRPAPDPPRDAPSPPASAPAAAPVIKARADDAWKPPRTRRKKSEPSPDDDIDF